MQSGDPPPLSSSPSQPDSWFIALVNVIIGTPPPQNICSLFYLYREATIRILIPCRGYNCKHMCFDSIIIILLNISLHTLVTIMPFVILSEITEPFLEVLHFSAVISF